MRTEREHYLWHYCLKKKSFMYKQRIVTERILFDVSCGWLQQDHLKYSARLGERSSIIVINVILMLFQITVYPDGKGNTNQTFILGARVIFHHETRQVPNICSEHLEVQCTQTLEKTKSSIASAWSVVIYDTKVTRLLTWWFKFHRNGDISDL